MGVLGLQVTQVRGPYHEKPHNDGPLGSLAEPHGLYGPEDCQLPRVRSNGQRAFARGARPRLRYDCLKACNGNPRRVTWAARTE